MNRTYETWLDIADIYAKNTTGCTKVDVGCAIVSENGTVVAIGANIAVPNHCHSSGCLRIQKYGDNAKEHRLPSDCRAVHSEIDALTQCGSLAMNGTAYVTRYPCEACARALAIAGISKVVYGRGQQISPMAAKIFKEYDVEVVWYKEWESEDVTT